MLIGHISWIGCGLWRKTRLSGGNNAGGVSKRIDWCVTVFMLSTSMLTYEVSLLFKQVCNAFVDVEL